MTTESDQEAINQAKEDEAKKAKIREQNRIRQQRRRARQKEALARKKAEDAATEAMQNTPSTAHGAVHNVKVEKVERQHGLRQPTAAADGAPPQINATDGVAALSPFAANAQQQQQQTAHGVPRNQSWATMGPTSTMGPNGILRDQAHAAAAMGSVGVATAFGGAESHRGTGPPGLATMPCAQLPTRGGTPHAQTTAQVLAPTSMAQSMPTGGGSHSTTLTNREKVFLASLDNISKFRVQALKTFTDMMTGACSTAEKATARNVYASVCTELNNEEQKLCEMMGLPEPTN